LVQDPPAELRSDVSLNDGLYQLHLKGNVPPSEMVHKGVKGPSALIDLKYFSITEGFVVDYMHNLCSGCVREHLEWMLHPKVGKRMWEGMEENNIGMDHLIKAIDSRIASVQSSTSSFRQLRKMSLHANWKAREYLVWIVFYAVPCLMGLLKNEYLLHFSLLSAAVTILLQKSVTVHDLREADRLLWMYAVFYQNYFGEKRMVYNVHLLSHIKTSVENFGPMWGYSSFPYEGQNAYILRSLLCGHGDSNEIYSLPVSS